MRPEAMYRLAITSIVVVTITGVCSCSVAAEWAFTPTGAIRTSGAVRALTLSRDSRLLGFSCSPAVASAFADVIGICDLKSGITRTINTSAAQNIVSLVFSPDGKLVAYCVENGTIACRDAGSGKPVWSYRWAEANMRLPELSVRRSPRDESLLATGYDGVLRVRWSDGHKLGDLKFGQSWSEKLSSDGTFATVVESTSLGFTLRLVDATTSREIAKWWSPGWERDENRRVVSHWSDAAPPIVGCLRPGSALAGRFDHGAADMRPAGPRWWLVRRRDG